MINPVLVQIIDVTVVTERNVIPRSSCSAFDLWKVSPLNLFVSADAARRGSHVVFVGCDINGVSGSLPWLHFFFTLCFSDFIYEIPPTKDGSLSYPFLRVLLYNWGYRL